MNFLECATRNVWNDLKAHLAPLIALVGLVLFFALVGCLLSGTAPVCLPAWFEVCLYALGFIVAIAVLILLISVLFNGTLCLFDAAADAFTDATGIEQADSVVTSGLTAMDCASAREELARLQRELETARSARDARAADVEAARRRVNAAVAALATAVVAVAAIPFWRPDLISGALVAVVVAGALVVRRATQLARAEDRLRAAQDVVERALAAVAAAAVIVDDICSEEQSGPTGEPLPPGGGFEVVPRRTV